MKGKLASRKLWIAVSAIVGLGLTAWAQGRPIPVDDIMKIAVAYISGQSLVDLFRPDSKP